MTTEERVEALEHQLARMKRRNRWLILVAGLAVATCIVGSLLPSTEVRAHRFSLVDDTGTSRAVLCMSNDGPFLALYHVNGSRAILSMDIDGPVVSLLDANGNHRVTLGLSTVGPVLSLHDVNGTSRAGLSVDSDGPMLILNDANAKLRAGLSAHRTGSSLVLYDANATLRAGLNASARDGPSLHLLDATRRTIWSAP